ncbi:hypothetical protein Hanom_Chr16g01505021 [Helianthus anomalus]
MASSFHWGNLGSNLIKFDFKTPSGTAITAASAKNVVPFSIVTFTPFLRLFIFVTLCKYKNQDKKKM